MMTLAENLALRRAGVALAVYVRVRCDAFGGMDDGQPVPAGDVPPHHTFSMAHHPFSKDTFFNDCEFRVMCVACSSGLFVVLLCNEILYRRLATVA